MLVNVNKLKPYQFLDDEADTTYHFELVYWEGHKDVDVDNKNKDNNEEPIYMVQIAQIDEKSVMKAAFFVTMHVDDIHLDVVLDGNQQCSILNHENLEGKKTNQGA